MDLWMIAKSNFGFLTGLGAVLSFMTGVISLSAIVSTQLFNVEFGLRREWMNRVEVPWVLLSFGMSVLCAAAFWRRTRALSDETNAPSEVPPEQCVLDALDDRSPDENLISREVPGKVWVCAFSASRLGRDIRAEADETHSLELQKRYRKGSRIGASEFPRKFRLRGKLVAQDVMISGFMFVSDEVAEVLQGFDLDQNELIPLEGIYRGRDRTPLENGYSLLTLVNRKSAFSADDSVQSAVSQWAAGIPKWHILPDDNPERSIAVTESSLQGADIWIDPATPLFLFFSDRLKEALEDQGIGKKMGFNLCRVIRATQH